MHMAAPASSRGAGAAAGRSSGSSSASGSTTTRSAPLRPPPPPSPSFADLLGSDQSPGTLQRIVERSFAAPPLRHSTALQAGPPPRQASPSLARRAAPQPDAPSVPAEEEEEGEEEEEEEDDDDDEPTSSPLDDDDDDGSEGEPEDFSWAAGGFDLNASMLDLFGASSAAALQPSRPPGSVPGLGAPSPASAFAGRTPAGATPGGTVAHTPGVADIEGAIGLLTSLLGCIPAAAAAPESSGAGTSRTRRATAAGNVMSGGTSGSSSATLAAPSTPVQQAASPGGGFVVEAAPDWMQPLLRDLVTTIRGESDKPISSADLVLVLQTLLEQRQRQHDLHHASISSANAKWPSSAPAAAPYNPTLSLPAPLPEQSGGAVGEAQSGVPLFSFADFPFADDDEEDPDWDPVRAAYANAVLGGGDELPGPDAQGQDMLAQFGSLGQEARVQQLGASGSSAVPHRGTPAGPASSPPQALPHAEPSGSESHSRRRAPAPTVDPDASRELSDAAWATLVSRATAPSESEDEQRDGSASASPAAGAARPARGRPPLSVEERARRRRERNRISAARARERRLAEREDMRAALDSNGIRVPERVAPPRPAVDDAKQRKREEAQHEELLRLQAENRMLRAEMERLRDENAALRARDIVTRQRLVEEEDEETYDYRPAPRASGSRRAYDAPPPVPPRRRADEYAAPRPQQRPHAGDVRSYSYSDSGGSAAEYDDLSARRDNRLAPSHSARRRRGDSPDSELVDELDASRGRPAPPQKRRRAVSPVHDYQPPTRHMPRRAPEPSYATSSTSHDSRAYSRSGHGDAAYLHGAAEPWRRG
ncbi:hypothetical protein FA09DRAFT_359545 [Tilletiopsis washingtonensis]|uniref:BZIP domain-containing protein n=1 Tax=Tilletiopsis washingtonensis TaxID=58919 RepID=A0A316ZER7_9BASI|nr:hypothetical protein FA09DRAFT_359545 [Tilletiopsis washingtonensis]PWN99534.1 hypothetical protein FA09DRAFT_359545 [Tilletiopsis washingtonensis]